MKSSPVMKVSFQRTKREDFYTHYLIGVLAYVVISRQLFWNWSLEEYPHEKQLHPEIHWFLYLKHFLKNYIHLKLWYRMYLKEMFLLNCLSWEVLRFKFDRHFKNNLLISWCLAIKSLLRHPLESKAFSTSRISYLRCYFQGFSTSICLAAAMLPIMEKPNIIWKSEFVNI